MTREMPDEKSLSSSRNYSIADIEEYLSLLQNKLVGLDGPDPNQWKGIEQFIAPFVQ